MTTNISFANVRKVAALAVVFMLLFAAISCDTSKKEESINVPFTEFLLSETDCQWVNIIGNKWADMEPWINSGKVIMINSNEEFKKYIECISNNHPDIDFSKQTLLLVSGTTNVLSVAIANSFHRLSTNEYILNVDVFLGDGTMVDRWTIALATNKLSMQSEIQLNVNVKN